MACLWQEMCNTCLCDDRREVFFSPCSFFSSHVVSNVWFGCCLFSILRKWKTNEMIWLDKDRLLLNPIQKNCIRFGWFIWNSLFVALSNSGWCTNCAARTRADSHFLVMLLHVRQEIICKTAHQLPHHPIARALGRVFSQGCAFLLKHAFCGDMWDCIMKICKNGFWPRKTDPLTSSANHAGSAFVLKKRFIVVSVLGGEGCGGGGVWWLTRTRTFATVVGKYEPKFPRHSCFVFWIQRSQIFL